MTLNRPATATPSFTAPFVTASTQLCFDLTVNNGAPPDNTGTDQVIVTVYPYSTPTVLLDLNAGSFAVGDRMVLTLRALTPPTGGPFPLALSLWAKIPSGERVNLGYMNISLPAGFDSGEVTILDGPLPHDLSTGSYEFGVLEDAASREDISVSTVLFQVR